jgi:hypothetical protein
MISLDDGRVSIWRLRDINFIKIIIGKIKIQNKVRIVSFSSIIVAAVK